MIVNKIKIAGDKNIVLQDVKDSTIEINNNSSLDELKDFIYDLHAWRSSVYTNTLKLFVIAGTRYRIAELQRNRREQLPLLKYGEAPRDWKPFANGKSIIHLIKEFHEKSGFNIEAYFIDNWFFNDEEVNAYLKDDISPYAVLIADAISLNFEENIKFAKIFDDANIGGCLVPICNTDTEQVKDFSLNSIKSTFRHLYTCYYKKFNKNYMYIALDILSKELLFRHLTDIAIGRLNIKPLPKIKWHQKLLDQKDSEAFTKLKTTFD